MSPTALVNLLGLCNIVAGALLALAPALVAPVDGVHSPAATLAARSAATLLLAVAVGAWAMPPDAVRTFLWIFGVGVKGAAALIWAATALDAGEPRVWVGAAVDGSVAAIIAFGLTTSSPRDSASSP